MFTLYNASKNIKSKIAEYLTYIDILNFTLTCKKCFKIREENDFWSHLILKHFNQQSKFGTHVEYKKLLIENIIETQWPYDPENGSEDERYVCCKFDNTLFITVGTKNRKCESLCLLFNLRAMNRLSRRYFYSKPHYKCSNSILVLCENSGVGLDFYILDTIKCKFLTKTCNVSWLLKTKSLIRDNTIGEILDNLLLQATANDSELFYENATISAKLNLNLGYLLVTDRFDYGEILILTAFTCNGSEKTYSCAIIKANEIWTTMDQLYRISKNKPSLFWSLNLFSDPVLIKYYKLFKTDAFLPSLLDGTECDMKDYHFY